MTPQDFIAKWRAAELKERSASQSHFNDLCALLGVLDPIAADPTGEWFTFEKAHRKHRAAMAGPMSGARGALRGNIKARAKTWTKRSASCCNTASRWKIRLC